MWYCWFFPLPIWLVGCFDFWISDYLLTYLKKFFFHSAWFCCSLYLLLLNIECFFSQNARSGFFIFYIKICNLVLFCLIMNFCGKFISMFLFYVFLIMSCIFFMFFGEILYFFFCSFGVIRGFFSVANGERMLLFSFNCQNLQLFIHYLLL